MSAEILVILAACAVVVSVAVLLGVSCFIDIAHSLDEIREELKVRNDTFEVK